MVRGARCKNTNRAVYRQIPSSNSRWSGKFRKILSASPLQLYHVNQTPPCIVHLAYKTSAPPKVSQNPFPIPHSPVPYLVLQPPREVHDGRTKSRENGLPGGRGWYGPQGRPFARNTFFRQAAQTQARFKVWFWVGTGVPPCCPAAPPYT